jgi:hypothetical protein
VSNVGTADLMISASLSPGAFSLSQVETSPMVIEPGHSAQIDVTYQPTAVGSDTETLVLQSNDPDTPQVSVSLDGTGIDAPVPEP